MNTHPPTYNALHPITRAIELICEAIVKEHPRLGPSHERLEPPADTALVLHLMPDDEPAWMHDAVRALDECGEPWPCQ